MTVSRECRVCSDKSDGLHFGVDACRACAAFFRRSVALKKNYVCRHGQGSCVISKTVRCMCRCCRFQKCLQTGMLPDAVQQQRDQIGKRCEMRASSFSPIVKRESPDSTFSTSPGYYQPMSICGASDSGLRDPGLTSTYSPIPYTSIIPEGQGYPALSRMRDGYLELKSRRLLYDLEDDNMKKIPKPKAVTQRYCGRFLLHDQYYVGEFVKYSFAHLNEIDPAQKQLLFRSFLPIFVFLESGYTTSELCPTNENIFVLPCGNYIDFNNISTFYANGEETKSSNSLDPTEIARIFDPSFKLFIRNVHQPMRFLKMTMIEFVAVCALVLFSHGIEGETEETEIVAKTARDEIFTELCYYYKYVQGMTDYALRLGNLMLVLPALQRVIMRHKEDLEIGKLFNVNNFDEEVYNLMSGYIAMSDEVPKSPTLSELPKLPTEIASAVTSPVHLHHVETHEKVVLPSAEDVQQERRHVELVSGIENFSAERLRTTSTDEKIVLPSPQDIAEEKKHEEFKAGIEHFDTEKLKQVETEEKYVLPSPEDIAREKVAALTAQFDHGELKHVNPIVKTGLPTKEEYAREKVKDLAKNFNHGQLKHVEPVVKNNVEGTTSNSN